MFKFFYNLIIVGYGLLIWLFSFFNKKASQFIKGRRSHSYVDVPPKQTRYRYWIHVSSLGEFEQGRPLIEELKNRHSKIEIILSFFSPSGFEVKKDYEKVDKIIYLPLDTPQNAKKFIETLRPDAAIIVKYEFWLNLLGQCFRHNIPVIYLSAIFKPEQIYFNSGKDLYLPVFRKVDRFFVQDEISLFLLEQHGITRATLSGDTRFDRVSEIAANAKSIPVVDDFVQNEPVFVFGSTWRSDIEKVKPFIDKMAGKFKFIIAPHNISTDEINLLQKTFNKSVLFSVYSKDKTNADILIIDNIGMLSSLYSYARYAYVGGAFRGALHNTLEAAVYGIPVFFGENSKNRKFNEAITLVEGGGAFTFENPIQLIEQVQKLEASEKKYEEAAEFSRIFVKQSKGATGKVINYLEENNMYG